MPLCWTANSDISARLTAKACTSVPSAPLSIVLGTTRLRDEADGIKEGAEEDEIGEHAVGQHEAPGGERGLSLHLSLGLDWPVLHGDGHVRFS